MKLEKAIEINRLYLFNSHQGNEADLRTARRILIEAGKRICHDRLVMQAKHILLLPGETED